MSIKQYSQSWSTFRALIYRDISIFVPFMYEKFVNALVWIGSVTIAFEYIFPQMGMPHMGGFIAIGSMVAWNFFGMIQHVNTFLSDLEGEKSISYYLTLPISQGLVIVRMALSIGIQGMLLSLLFLPLLKLLLGNGLSLAHVSWFKFFLIYCTYNLMYGTLTLFFVSCVKHIYSVMTIWQRYMWTMWYFGCAQFSWATLYKVNPLLAYLNLLNPMTFAMEGTRAAVFGQEGSLNFWYCFVMLWVFISLTLWIGVKRLKKRLDCLV
jgi:hypothetical protein